MEVCTNCTTLSSSSSGEVIRLLNSVAKNSATSSLKKADCRAEDDPPCPPQSGSQTVPYYTACVYRKAGTIAEQLEPKHTLKNSEDLAKAFTSRQGEEKRNKYFSCT